MGPIRLGVIGVGSLGQHHARLYADIPEADLIAVVDTDDGRAQAVAAKHHCRALAHFQDLFGQVDAVSIAVPTPLHHRIARKCLEGGVHVLVEKPMTATLEDAQDLVEIAEAQKLILQVGHIERFNSALRAGLGAIKGPRLIECRRWAPFTPRGADVDVVLDLMIHDLDIVLSVLATDVQTVEAQGVSLVSSTTDVAHARVLFDTGCTAIFSASRVAEAKVRELRFYEPESFLVVDLLDQTARIGRRIIGPEGDTKIIAELIRGDRQEPLKLELQAFLESVRHRTPPLVSGNDGVAALRLAERIMAQINRGRVA
ncbi:MAG: Gfo/Idh/MocA family oxidoreductase [Nitrospirota bacterium]